MRLAIKWKIFLLFLAFSPIPLIIVSYINQKETRKLGAVVSDDVRTKMVHIASESLHMTARNYSQTLRRNKFQFEYLLAMLASQVELLLHSEPGQESLTRQLEQFRGDFENEGDTTMIIVKVLA